MTLFSFPRRTLLVAIASASLGCGTSPSRVDQPEIDPHAAGRQAMELYDTNGDGQVAGQELDGAPGLKAALRNFDTDGNGAVTAEEVSARVRVWQASKAGVMNVRCQVMRGGNPLTGAVVTFEPEEFLGDDIRAASGEVAATGLAMLSIPREKRPTADYPAGVQLGLYKVRITMPGNAQAIPALYNTETTLGQEVSYDDPDVLNNRVRFDLK